MIELFDCVMRVFAQRVMTSMNFRTWFRKVENMLKVSSFIFIGMIVDTLFFFMFLCVVTWLRFEGK